MNAAQLHTAPAPIPAQPAATAAGPAAPAVIEAVRRENYQLRAELERVTRAISDAWPTLPTSWEFCGEPVTYSAAERIANLAAMFAQLTEAEARRKAETIEWYARETARLLSLNPHRGDHTVTAADVREGAATAKHWRTLLRWCEHCGQDPIPWDAERSTGSALCDRCQEER